MISYIKGLITDISEGLIVVENNQIGYNIFVPNSLITDIPDVGSEVKIHTYLYIREDAMHLYGFLSKDDLMVFRLLLGVNGIGPKGALGVLSTITPDDLRLAVLADDVKAISRAPGIGAKTAQKLIIELKDKLKIEHVFEQKDTESNILSQATSGDIRSEAVQALVALGYSQTDALKAVRKVDTHIYIDVESVLKAALSLI